MKSKMRLLGILFCSYLSAIYGQHGKQDINSVDTVKPIIISNFTELKLPTSANFINGSKIKKNQNWKIDFQQTNLTNPTSSRLDSLKKILTLKKQRYDYGSSNKAPEIRSNVPEPYVTKIWKNSSYNKPPDNSIAISDDGNIVFLNNSNIFYLNDQGQDIDEYYYDQLFIPPGPDGFFFDPKILYDPNEKKFIMVVLYKDNIQENTSRVYVAYSKSSNPSDGWYTYYYQANVIFRPGIWFDYPNIGVSKTELFISCNVFTTDKNEFAWSTIFQIRKEGGFRRDNTPGISWSNINDCNGNLAFSIYPLSHGFEDDTHPGMYLICSDDQPGINGSNKVTLFYIDNIQSNNPHISITPIIVEKYYLPGKASQLNSSVTLDVGDCRIKSGFYNNNIIHFVMNSADERYAFSKIYYGRIDVGNKVANTDQLGTSGDDYCYPVIAPFSTTESNNSVLIGFLRVTKYDYPEFRVLTYNNNFEKSNSVLVTAGTGPLMYPSANHQNNARWGDYIGIARRHNEGYPTVWVAGQFGSKSGYLNDAIARISEIPFITPICDFHTSNQVIDQGSEIQFYDKSTNNPTSWNWEFEGGDPKVSTDKNPIVKYNNSGSYDVHLTTSNLAGGDDEIKRDYIYVKTLSSLSDVPITKSTTIKPNLINRGDKLNVNLELVTDKNITINIINTNGLIVKKLMQRKFKAGSCQISFDTSNLIIGEYFILLLDDNSFQSQMVKFVIN